MIKLCQRCRKDFETTDEVVKICDACVIEVKKYEELGKAEPKVEIKIPDQRKQKFDLINTIADRLTEVSHTNQKQLPGQLRAKTTLALNQTSDNFNELVKILKKEEVEKAINSYRLLAQRLITMGITDRVPTLDELWSALEITPETLLKAIQVEYLELTKKE